VLDVVFRLAACGGVALLAGLFPVAAAAHNIKIGPGKSVGDNLFDSRAGFSLAEGQSAIFTGPSTIGNIIFGVTGGRPSRIDGTIISAIRGANLYFINPNGVVFGPQSRVNVSGSFYAATADYLKLGRNGRFDVTHPGGSRLTAAAPAAFGFLDAKPAAIRVKGSELGPVPGTLGLIAGPISVRDGAFAQARAIDVTAVAGKGLVPVDPRRKAALTVKRFGRVAIAGNSMLDATAGKAGLLAVTAGRLSLSGGAELLSKTGAGILVSARSVLIDRGGEISASTSGAGKGGRIVVDVQGGLTIDGAGGALTGLVANAKKDSRGNAGDITVTARRLLLAESGRIVSNTFGAGNGGNVSVKVAGEGPGALTIRTDGEIAAATFGAGNGGKVSVAVHGGLTIDGAGGSFPPKLAAASGNRSMFTGILASANPDSTGTAGNVTVTAGRLLLAAFGAIESGTAGAGRGGEISVHVTGAGARALAIRTNGEITAGTSGAGKGGNILVDVNGGLTIDGAGGGFPPKLAAAGGKRSMFTGILASANPRSKGNAGVITVTAGRLRLAESGRIVSNTFGPGHGGNVLVRVAGEGPGALTIRTDGEIAAATFGAGNGGEVSVGVRGGLTIDGAGGSFTGIVASANPGSTGNAGDITVTAGRLALAASGTIVSNTFGASSGGRVAVDVTGRGARALVIRTDGAIAASTFGKGNGGRIAVDVQGGLTIDGAGTTPPFVTGILADAEAGSTGNAGDASVRAGSLTILDGGAITNSAVGARNHQPASTGNAGAISVKVGGLLALEGRGSRIATTTAAGTIGCAGSVMVSAGQISIAAGGGIVSTTAGTGSGGPVVVTTPGLLALDGAGSQIAASATGSHSGPGGNVSVTAGSLTIGSGAEIASSSAGSGDAGMIAVAAARLLLNGGAAISTQATSANGGNITLSIGDLLDIVGSEITTSVQGQSSNGNGGNINIGAGLVVLDQSKIVAQAQEGNGGNIMINKEAGTFIETPDSIVSASSQKGISGVVEINGIAPLNGALVVLSSELRSAVALSENTCAARAGRPRSSLVEAGRGGLPQDPDASLPALYTAGRDLRLAPRPAAPGAAAGGEPPRALRVAMRCGGSIDGDRPGD
jgi:filamentous hemagglutinin family protein